MADETQFLIDIAAKLTGGDAAVASLVDIGDKLLASGASAAGLERTVKQMAGELETATAALRTSGDAVSAGEAKYRQLEGSADRAAKAVERIGQQADLQRGKLQAALDVGDAKGADRVSAKIKSLVERQAEAATKAETAAAAIREEAAALDALKAKAGVVASQHAALTKGLKNVQGAAETAKKAELAAAGTGKVNEMAEAFAKIGGPAGMAGQKIFGLATGFKKLGASIGSAGLYIAAAVAIVAIATAAVSATIAIGHWAVGLADANRTQGLLAAGVAHSVAGGVELDRTIQKLGATVPQTREELLAMAGDLAKSGLRGKELSSALETAAIKAATLKFGPDFAKQMLALDVQAKRLQEDIAGTFGGLKIDGLLDGVSTIVALFDSTTESGAALKVMFEGLFQPIIDSVASTAPTVERFFLQAEILALKAYLAMRPYSGIIVTVGKALLIASAVIVGVFVAAVMLVVGAVALLVAGIGAWFILLYRLDGLISGAITAMQDLAAQMVAGLVNGITGAADAVVKAITGVIGGGIDAAKKLLHLGSPSKLFADMGDMTVQGYVAGVDDGAPDAQAALEAMVAPPKVPSIAASGAAAQVGNVSIAITVDGRGESDDSLAAKIAAAVRDIFEGDALMLGAGEAT